jgi:hypothetical protein
MRVPGSPTASTGKSLRDSRIDRAALLAVQGSLPLSHLPWSGGQLPAASPAGKAYLSGNSSLLAQLQQVALVLTRARHTCTIGRVGPE